MVAYGNDPLAKATFKSLRVLLAAAMFFLSFALKKSDRRASHRREEKL
jgi:hypothetical protein